MLKLTTRSPWWEFEPVLLAREPFETGGALSGEAGAPANPWGYGQLPPAYHASVSRADYVIYSYSTPIAWHTEDGWVMPDVKYSVTTSRHQSRIRIALSGILDEMGAGS